ncbi:MAG: hypothetical protein HQQ73_11305 [Desulfobulbaceae bacterium]|nr:hypothetical protein [Desulfobulbaceae bacterium]
MRQGPTTPTPAESDQKKHHGDTCTGKQKPPEARVQESGQIRLTEGEQPDKKCRPQGQQKDLHDT